VAGKNRNFGHFLPFFGLRHLVVWLIGSSLRKLNTGIGIKIVSVLQRLHGEIADRAHNL